jgi:hypothetical protein
MSISETLLEVRESTREGYSPVLDYGAWRVAILNYADQAQPQNLTAMGRHDETDEVFVLLRGRCILFLGEGDEAVTAIYAEDMQPYKVYNVKKGTWHASTLTEEGMVLIVENRDTSGGNSASCLLTGAQRATVVERTRGLWGESPGK